MLFKKIIGVLFLSVICFNSIAQVNLQTGSSTFSLPMLNWQDDKSRLNSVVALSYNSGNGLRVGDIASNVGQGWSLIAGGEILRMQNGEPDDQVAKNGDEWDITKYPAGILNATIKASQGCPAALTKYPIYGWKNQLYKPINVIAEDKQLDYFSFNFNGKTGQFVVDLSNIGNCKSIGDTKLKISFQQDANLINQGIRTNITSFTIQDVDGLIYKFTVHSVVKLLELNYSDWDFNYTIRQPKKFKHDHIYHQSGFDNGSIVNPYVITGWVLSEIDDPFTNRKIYFNYVTRNINAWGGDDISLNLNKNYTTVQRKKSITQSPELSSIVYPDGHNVNINFNSTARFDLPGEFAISSIDIMYNGRYLSQYQLSSTYFIKSRYGTPISEYQKSVCRLCLQSVKKIGVDLKEDSPPYSFDYYTGSNNPDDFVPPPFYWAKDNWGYFNGDYSKGFYDDRVSFNTNTANIRNSNFLKGLCFLNINVSGTRLNAKSGYAKNGLLRQIVYPTGGTLTYQYEQNTGILNNSTTIVGGVHVSQTNSTDGGNSNGCNAAVTTNYSYTMNGPGSASSLWGLEMPLHSVPVYSHYQPEWKGYHWTLSCAPFGCCYWHYQYPGIFSAQQSIDAHSLLQSPIVSNVLGILAVGGTIQDIITILNTSGGLTLGEITAIIDVALDIFEIGLTCIGNQSKDYNYTYYYNLNLNEVSPLPVQFKRVEVTENSGGIGKTVQEFTSEDDFAIWEPTNSAFSAKQRFAPWAYGLPKRTAVYDVNGNIIKESINHYDFSKIDYRNSNCGAHGQNPCFALSKVPLHDTSAKCNVLKTYSQRNVDWSDPAHYNSPYYNTSTSDINVDIYDLYTGRVELQSTEERSYNANSSNYLPTITNYQYNNNTSSVELNKITSTQSNGDVTEKYIKYTTDYSGGAISTLLQNNIVTLPVESFTDIYGPQKPGGYLNENVTEFALLANGDIKPVQVLEQRFNQPQAVMGTYQGPGSNTSSYKITQQFTYDVLGNQIGLKDEGNRTIRNIYDYDDKYIVGTAINADPVNDNVSYTSFETSGLGGWTFGGKFGTVTYNNNSSVTGARAISLSSIKTLSSAINTAKPYTLSFWATTSVTVSSGCTLSKSAPTINGYTYYEYDVAQATTTVMLSGPCTIDELRLYPNMARMHTTTYDPLIGKTSDCDENNRITYYNYDNLGRLQFIKDEKQNIIKMYEYNNVSASKLNGCPGIYYSHFISELFTRSSCGQGYVGDTITYTVPSNMFSSQLSQADADIKAENYLLANGQSFADAHTSCRPLYYNVAISVTDTTQNCTIGYIGGLVVYTVPYGRYSSTESQAAADSIAQDDLDANGQFFANNPPNSVCNLDLNPLWTWLEGASWYCANVAGYSEPHLFVLETDINPNSSSYLSTRWSDTGPSDMCPTGSYYNSLQSGTFIRNNCPTGQTGSTVVYTVPAGTYSSSISQAAADQLAINDVTANGQNYANSHGTCSAGCDPITCTGYDHKCINNACELGVRVNTDSYFNGILWVCIYHYEFSDGSWSDNFMEYNSSPCAL